MGTGDVLDQQTLLFRLRVCQCRLSRKEQYRAQKQDDQTREADDRLARHADTHELKLEL
jgi:hypothetical protein